MNRPVKAFDAILNSVVMELRRSPGARVKLTLEIEAEAASGFNDADVGVVRDNTKQLKFTPGSTGFSDCRAETALQTQFRARGVRLPWVDDFAALLAAA
jgi:hypothetical protein